MKGNIKVGKSRQVTLYDDYVIKKALHTDVDKQDLIFYIIMGHYGTFENLKEVYFWTSIKNNQLLASIFNPIDSIDMDNNTIKANKLEPVSEELFYKKIYPKYKKLSLYTLGYQDIIDNHTIDNFLNYGFDLKGNLKLVDYAMTSGSILTLYNLGLEDIKDINVFNQLCLDMKSDIINNDIKHISNINVLLPLVLTLKYYNNPLKYYYYIYKYKLLNLKSIIDMILDK